MSSRVRRFGPSDTQWLTRASFEPTAGRRLRKRLLLAIAGLAVLIVGAVRSGVFDDQLMAPLRLIEARRENASLSAGIEQVRMELAMERATRSDLQRQAEELSVRVAELTQQLQFVTSRNPSHRPAPAVPAPVTVAQE